MGAKAATESDEEHTLQEYGIARALPVDGREPNWELEEPDSAEEYLRRVRHEARNLPDVVQSDIDPRQFDAMRSVSAPLGAVQEDQLAVCPPETLQSPEWMAAFLSMFERLRVQTVSTPTLHQPPQSQLRLAKLLGKSVDALCTPESGMLNGEAAEQVFALSCRLDRPISADAAALFRRLWRRCRARCAEAAAEGAPDPAASVLIGVAGGVFGQDPGWAAFAGRLGVLDA